MHAPQAQPQGAPYGQRPAMPPLVSPAPTTGQAQGAPFAPRPGPAARVSSSRGQKSPFAAKPVEEETKTEDMTDEATISEEPSEPDDDQIETLVLVRDKLPLAKKLT